MKKKGEQPNIDARDGANTTRGAQEFSLPADSEKTNGRAADGTGKFALSAHSDEINGRADTAKPSAPYSEKASACGGKNNTDFWQDGKNTDVGQDGEDGAQETICETFQTPSAHKAPGAKEALQQDGATDAQQPTRGHNETPVLVPVYGLFGSDKRESKSDSFTSKEIAATDAGGKDAAKQRRAAKRAARASEADGDALGLRSIQFRTWMSFVMLTAITLIILWFVQILFYTSSFKDMNKNELRRAGDVLIADVNSFGFSERLRSSALGNGFSGIVFAPNSASSVQILEFANANGSTSVDSLDLELFQQIVMDNETFFREVSRANGSVVYMTQPQDRGSFIVYGARTLDRNGQTLYLCLLKPLVHLDASVAILRNQLVIVTIICMLLSMMLSFVFSRKISKPITQFSQVARKLGKGDFTVRFEGNGWTEIDELADTLNYATDEMGKTEALRRDFLANVSHDLRTPLTMVKAYAEMIRDFSGASKEKREAHAQIIIDEADRLTTLVGDILDLSKLQAGTEESARSEQDVSQLTQTVLSRFAAMSEKSGYKFESAIEENLVVTCDARRIEQVLYNLIGNAMNYAGEDKTVRVRARDAGECVRVEVSDNGKGIAEEEKDAVWDRYYRANQTKRTTVGTGLGLSIVKNILSAHNARFGIDSVCAGNPEGTPSGTTFWFELDKNCPPIGTGKRGDASVRR